MPLPFLLIPIALKMIGVAKTGAVVAKGATVISHVGGTHAATTAFHTAQVHVGTTAATAGAVATCSVIGGTAVIFESGKATLDAIEAGDVHAIVRTGTSLFSQMHGIGGVTNFDSSLADLGANLNLLPSLDASVAGASVEKIKDLVLHLIAQVQSDLAFIA